MTERFFPWTQGQILAAMERKKYSVFRGNNYDLNLIGIRTVSPNKNEFDDWFTISYLGKQGWNLFVFPCTTDPGNKSLQSQTEKGTAIVVPGQYRGLWKLGLHKGKFPALVQVGTIAVYRDADRDTELDMDPAKIDRGLFGINCHQATQEGTSVVVDDWSAGCQVVPDSFHFRTILTIANLQAAAGSPSFSYTLLTSKDLS